MMKTNSVLPSYFQSFNRVSLEFFRIALNISSELHAILKALPTPYSHLSETILGWGFGLLSIVALLITILGKSESKFKLAQLLVTISVIAGMILTFII